MINYTKRNVLIITLTLTVLIDVVISVIWSNVNTNKEDEIINNTQEETIKIQNTEENIEPKKDKMQIWKIEIPEINLSANILEGTNPRVIAKYVGHFTRN